MKLFIDTSNKKFILALINDLEVIAFEMKDTNNNVAKMANKWIEQFLKKNKIKLEDIETFYTTIGPGSFTGVKVSANIINTIKLTRNIGIEVINTFDLLNMPGVDWIAMPFGKSKYYLKWNRIWKPGFKTVTELPKEDEKLIGIIGYENFDAIELQKKLHKFKTVSKVEPIYAKINYK